MSTEWPEVKEMAATIVKDYLTGHWKSASPSNITVEKLKGGYSNLLYQITLPSIKNQNEKTDPNTVLLRIHRLNFGRYSSEQLITDSLVFMLMSERKLGPKLHGVFPGGRIEEYVPARSLSVSELGDPKISSIIARKVAEIHSMNVPISKNPENLYDVMFKWLTALDKNWEQYRTEQTGHQILMDRFKSFDIFSEIKWLREHLKQFNSAIVFSHNDLQEGNILITHDSIDSNEPNLVFIDYEYCSYNYRGFELANHFLEYTMKYNMKEYPHFEIDLSVYPSVEQQLAFIREYLKTYNSLIHGITLEENRKDFSKIRGSQISSEISTITPEESRFLEEISNFRLLSHLLWGIWAATHSKIDIEFGYWDYAIQRLNCYFETKEELLNLQPMPKIKKL
ncbi:hypothetical protein RUM44_009291 [Polyplax serrata]|uniref:Choline kinase n=1 Tax=Polyplax serrata TaxID=468196 RepID=A0ABR1AS98_POLSC